MRIAAIALCCAGIAAMTALGIGIGKPLIEMLGDPKAFQAWVDAKGPLGRVAFIGVVALQVIIAWLPGEPLEIGAGYAFGFWEGSLLCMLGIVLGSVAVFLLVKRYGRRLIALFFPLERIDRLPLMQSPKRLTLLAFIVFMIPGTPKDILTYCVGLTPMKLRTWLLISGVARIPPVITSTLSGSALGQAQYWMAAAILAATALFSVIGLLAYRRLGRATSEVEG